MAEKLDLIVEGVNKLQKPLKEMGDGLENFYRQITGQGGSISDNMSKMTTSVGGLASAFTGAGGRIAAAGTVASAAVGVFAAMAYSVGKYAESYAGLERLSKTTGLKLNFIEAFKVQTEAMHIPEGLQILDNMSDFLSRLRRYDEEAVQELMKIQGPLPHELMKLIQRGGPREEQFDLIIKAMESVHDHDKNAIAAIITKRRDALATLKAYREAEHIAPKFITTPEEHHALMEIHEKWIDIQIQWDIFMDKLSKSSAPTWLPVLENLLKGMIVINTPGFTDFMGRVITGGGPARGAPSRRFNPPKPTDPQVKSFWQKFFSSISLISPAGAAEMQQQRPWTADRDVETGTYAGFRGGFGGRGAFPRGGGRGGRGGGGDPGPPPLNVPTSPENAPKSYKDQPGLAPTVSGGGQSYAGGSEKQRVAQIVANTFRAKGYSENEIAGILINVKSESDFQPGHRHFDQPKFTGEASFAHGLFQEGGDEWNNWVRWMQAKGLDPNTAWRDPKVQTEWIADRLNQPQYRALREAMRGKSKEDVAQLFLNEYLKPAAVHAARRTAEYGRGVPGVEQYTTPGKQTTPGQIIGGRRMTIEEIGLAVRRGLPAELVRQMTEQMAPAGTSPGTGAPGGLTTITTPSGRKLTVASQYAANFQGFVNDYEAAGGVIGPSSGGLGSRPGNPSYHPRGMAIDVNQIGYGIRSLTGRTLSQEQEDALAAKWGLFPGSRFGRRSDIGHFEVRNAAAAREALERNSLMSPSEREEFRDGVRRNISGGGSVGVSVSVLGPAGTTVKVTPDNDVFNVHKVNRILRPQLKEQLEEAD